MSIFRDFTAVILFYLLCFILVLHNVISQSNCRTPNGLNGTCIAITSCEPLLKVLYNRNRTQLETEFLRSSQCDSPNNKLPFVCCPPNVIRCVTPDNLSGKCIAAADCIRMSYITKNAPPETIEYLRASICQGPYLQSLCCSDIAILSATNQTETTTATEETTLDDATTSKPNFTAEIRIMLTDEEIDALLPSPDECGKEGVVDRIFGGELTTIDQYPWMVLVEYRTKRNTIVTSCGGSLISKRYVVTAAHCVAGIKTGTPVSVRLGEFNKTSLKDCVEVPGGEDCNDEPVSLDIQKIIVHPGYKEKENKFKNDIALIRTTTDAPYTDFIQPICLPTSDITVPETAKTLVVAGWGANEAKKTSDVKLQLSVDTVPLDECNDAFTKQGQTIDLWDKQLCAGGEKGKDSCKGDSGGPLMGDEHLQWTLHGIVSFGLSQCGTGNVPGVYTKVFPYLGWIRNSLEN